LDTQPTTKRKKNPAMLRVITPKTLNQQRIFDSFDKERHIFIHGAAGTGKTFVPLYLGLDAVINEKEFRQVVIVRSSVPARNQGFLPGNEDEKNAIFEAPYEHMVNTKLFTSPTKNYRQLKNEGIIKFISTSYLRGITVEDSVIIADEVQNMNDMEINTIITRTGDNCQLFLCGDTDQNDLMYLKEDSCIATLPHIIRRMRSFDVIEMTTDDNQRNAIVAEWIEARRNVVIPEPYWHRKG
jgi:phosphate starvation-inducible PhoH-like protein